MSATLSQVLHHREGCPCIDCTSGARAKREGRPIASVPAKDREPPLAVGGRAVHLIGIVSAFDFDRARRLLVGDDGYVPYLRTEEVRPFHRGVAFTFKDPDAAFYCWHSKGQVSIRRLLEGEGE